MMANGRMTEQEQMRQADELYEKYARPLERDHWGEYIAIAPDGRYLVHKDDMAAMLAGKESFGKGIYLFKIGPRAIAKLRRWQA